MGRKIRRPPSLVGAMGTAAGLALLVALFVTFAPTQLGGQTSFIVISGNSMEPKYHAGDLVLIREEESYAEGDVVVYRHADIGRVIHRIIGREGPGYIFKGDHNTFIDGSRPVVDDLVGRAWFSIPGAGAWLKRLQSPNVVGFLTFAAIVGFTVGALRPTRRRRRVAHQFGPAFIQQETRP